MTQEQYDQLYKDLGTVMNNQTLIFKKLERIHNDVETAINNTQILERIIDETSKKKMNRLSSISDEIRSLYSLLKG